jgi:hypothetical protein
MTITMTITEVIALLSKHMDIIDAAISAAEGGSPKPLIIDAIKAVERAASDAIMKAELPAGT